MLMQFVVIVWIAGVSIGLLRVLRGALVLQRLRRSLCPVTRPQLLIASAAACMAVGLRRRVAICESPLAPSPLLLGWWSPTIVLPEGLGGRLNDQQLHSVLSHEAAHIVRGDVAIAMLQQISAIGFWWNPFLHVINRRVSRLREQICDDYVADSQGTGTQLAEAILNVAEWCTLPSAPLQGVGMLLSEVEDLALRITRLTTKERIMNLRLNAKAKLSLAICTLLLSTALVIPVIRAENEGSPARSDTSLVGKWRAISCTFAGAPDISANGDVHTFGEKQMDRPNRRTQYAYTVDGKGEINLTAPRLGDQHLRGIYSIDGNTLKLCYAYEPDMSRPSEFVSAAGQRVYLYEYERVEE